jgi:hypothetical protein
MEPRPRHGKRNSLASFLRFQNDQPVSDEACDKVMGPGFLGGVAFSVVLGMLGRRRLDQLATFRGAFRGIEMSSRLSAAGTRHRGRAAGTMATSRPYGIQALGDSSAGTESQAVPGMIRSVKSTRGRSGLSGHSMIARTATTPPRRRWGQSRAMAIAPSQLSARMMK